MRQYAGAGEVERPGNAAFLFDGALDVGEVAHGADADGGPARASEALMSQRSKRTSCRLSAA